MKFYFIFLKISLARISNYEMTVFAISLYQVGSRCLETGCWGAYYNVLINLDNITDKEERQTFKREAESLLEKAQAALKKVLDIASKRG